MDLPGRFAVFCILLSWHDVHSDPKIVATATNPDDFPNFQAGPLSPEECSVRQISICNPFYAFERDCTGYTAYQISVSEERYMGEVSPVVHQCDADAARADVRKQAAAIARLPLRPVRLTIKGGIPVNGSDVSPIRNQIVIVDVLVSQDPRTTGQLRNLGLINLVHYNTFRCFDLDIKKSDFKASKKLRMIAFFNSTIRTLEAGTFMDLPFLSVLTLEQLHQYVNETKVPATFDQHFRDYLSRLHCNCNFAWFRRWWSTNSALLRTVERSEIYSFIGAWSNPVITKEEMYVPIDCAEAVPFGQGNVNFNQTEYSLNDDMCEGA
ncbi:uncharacterized protein LOC129590029 [Paramacrobiotus metropolitanus]|uniref:uncharacterized protein LOC129590029 n=1 Tax=Paramacrobiotus metropolitanus TaxID=2943436 RepID=UPI0024460732|nr:uncharacterized protein LOC129590029 [Paramacrobiotus metropolitanus]